MAYDFLIIASPVFFRKLLIGEWIRNNLTAIKNKPVVIVTVSSPQAGPDLGEWLRNDLPPELASGVKHVAFPGRLISRDLSWYDRVILRFWAMGNRGPNTRKTKIEDFDFVDKSCVGPVEKIAREIQHSKAALPHRLA